MTNILNLIDKRLNQLTVNGEAPTALPLNKQTFRCAIEELKKFPYRFEGEKDGYYYVIYRGVPLVFKPEGEDLLSDK